MGERLAAGDADHGGAQAAEVIDAADHLSRGRAPRLCRTRCSRRRERLQKRLAQSGPGRVRSGGQGARHHPELRALRVTANHARAPSLYGELHLFY